MRIHACIGAGIAVLTLAVGACSSGAGDPAASSAEPASEWIAVARGQVDVEGGMVQVAARIDGVVETVAANQDEHVNAGQVLARLDPHAAKIQVAMAQGELAQAQAKLAELEHSLEQGRRRAVRLAAAAKAGVATGTAVAQAQADVMTLKMRQAGARAGLEVARQRLAGAQLELAGTTVRAPVAGTVVIRHIAIGQAVAAAGQPLFKLLPDAPQIVRAQVDARAAVHLRPGMHAEVVRASGSGPAYSATLLSVGKVLLAATLTPGPLERAVADDVDCTLKLAPPKAGIEPLPIGQRVTVKFPRQ